MIREATREDSNCIAGLIYKTWEKDLFGLVDEGTRSQFTQNWFSERVYGDLSIPTGCAFVYEINSELLGYLSLRLHADSSHSEIYGLYVNVNTQSQGVGTELFEKAKAVLRFHGSNEMLVWTLLGAPNNRFYEGQKPVKKFGRDLNIAGSSYSGIGYSYSL